MWTNDTGTPAYIRAAATATSVSFWIYSAPTGRTTTFSEPAEANLRWPYAGQPADPAHAPGYVVLGRDVWVTRSVVENGTEVHRDLFFSHYAPVWGGPGETPAVSAEPGARRPRRSRRPPSRGQLSAER